MAISPLPLNFSSSISRSPSSLSFSFPFNIFSSPTSSSTSSLSFLILQTRKYPSCGIRTHSLETFCSYQTIELETEESQNAKIDCKTKRKKRKLRPGFYDQVRDRWSLKIGSQRAILPWQEQESQEQQEQQEKEGQRPLLTRDSAEGDGGNPALADPVTFALGNRSILAPWSHGSKPKKTHFHSATDITPNTYGDCKEIGDFNGYREKSNASLFAKKVEVERVLDGNKTFKEEQRSDEFPGSVVKIRASPIGLAENKGKGFRGNAKGISLDRKRSGSNENVGILVASSDEGDPIRLPWKRERGSGSVDEEKWTRSNTELAEKMVPEPELRRLRNVALRMKERIKVGAAGITQALVDYIHEKWKEDEVVKVKFEGPIACNMKRTHEALESKTGGLVIWRSGSSLVLYRGMTYKLPCVQLYTKQTQSSPRISCHSKDSKIKAIVNVGVSDAVRTAESSTAGSVISAADLSEEELMDISDLNNLLDELGPRFTDWSGRDPQPVNADLLPCVVPGYKPPFRLLPYGIRPCLSNKQMTTFRRLARTVPPHFALGRNRQLQGLAMAMVKLWKRSAIAKIAIKRGVQNTCNERMAEEIKQLTGGTLLSRNKDYIVFYRGNDFLSPVVTEALVERQKLAELRQDEEEQAREGALALTVSNVKTARGPLVAGTLAETIAAKSRWGSQPSSEEMEKMMRDAALARHASLVSYLEKKLAHAKGKVKKAEKALGKVQEFLTPTELPTDLETITDEERFLFRKIGLSMKPFLLLGRREVFDGTVENIHLHWKHRELVKIIVKGKSFAQVKHIAISLEAESGGLLISLDKTTKGYAIIIYRGKNYQCPHALRPQNLLTRRQALARSIELQRREALNHHISDLNARIEMLKSELAQMEAVKETGDKVLCPRLDDTYSSDDDMEDEGEEAYLETYVSGDEDSDTPYEELVPDKEPIL